MRNLLPWLAFGKRFRSLRFHRHSTFSEIFSFVLSLSGWLDPHTAVDRWSGLSLQL